MAQVTIDGLVWKTNISGAKDVEENVPVPGMSKRQMYDKIFAFVNERIQATVRKPQSEDEVVESNEELVWESMPSYWSKAGKSVAFKVTTSGELNVTLRNKEVNGEVTKTGLVTYIVVATCADGLLNLEVGVRIDTYIRKDNQRSSGYPGSYLFKDYKDAAGNVYPDHQRLHERLGKDYKALKEILVNAATK